MGQESSTPIDESVPPDRLESRTVQGIAKYLVGDDEYDGYRKDEGRGKGRKAGKKIVVLVI